MSKKKSDFHELLFINPFDEAHFKKMVYPDWADRTKIAQWRKDNSLFLPSPDKIDLLDIDELITQWDVAPEERKVNPKTCVMVYKELCLVLRLIDAEHQDAMQREILPGVVQSSRDGKFIFISYDIEEPVAKKATKVISSDSEYDAYWQYMQNRNTMIEIAATKAENAKLIDPEVYDKYFYDLDVICVRDYEYYKEKKYKKG